jgi:transcriptional regulator with XRE-family HTH domain
MPLAIGEQLRAARAMLRLEQGQLAAEAGVHVNTVIKIEGSDGPISARMETVRRLERALEARGIAFTDGDEPGVRLRKRTPTAA